MKRTAGIVAGTMVLLGATALVAPMYAHATEESCTGTGTITAVTAVSPGHIRVTGTLTNCRGQGTDESASLKLVLDPSGGVRVAFMSFGAPGQTTTFDKSGEVGTIIDRVCLLAAPDRPVDCVAVDVPVQPDGTPGVPVPRKRPEHSTKVAQGGCAKAPIVLSIRVRIGGVRAGARGTRWVAVTHRAATHPGAFRALLYSRSGVGL